MDDPRVDGTGAFTPTPFTEETDETGLSRVLPLQASASRACGGASVDVTRELGPVEVTGTVFGSRVDDRAAEPRRVGVERRARSTRRSPTRTLGTELMVRYKAGASPRWRPTPGRTRPSRSRHWRAPRGAADRRDTRRRSTRSGRSSSGRFGIEGYYTGRQPLEDNPYRVDGHSLLAGRRSSRERRFGPRAAVRQPREPVRRPPDARTTRSSCRRGCPTAAGPWTPGRRSTAGSSTRESGSGSAELSRGVTGGMISSSGPCGERV